MKRFVLKFLVPFLIIIGAVVFWLFKPLNIDHSDDILIDIVPLPSNSVQLTICNNSAFPISFSNAYHIEVNFPLGWRKVNIRPAAFTSIGHELAPGDSYVVSINYESIYGSLSPGRYRLVKKFDYNNNSSYFAGYFSIE